MSNTAFNSNYISTSGSNSTQDFRLTLVSNTPVMTSEVLAATTLYLTPYIGNKIALYNGSAWDIVTSAQVSLSLSGFTADTNYDIFAYNNSGTVTLESLAWTSSGAGTSTRATALAYQDGVLVKSGTATRRYIGTIRTTGTTGQCQFSFGGLANGGVESKLFVWNYYNRIKVPAKVRDATDSWTYSTATWRPANNSTACRVSFICGLAEDNITASYINFGNSGACGISVGLNVTNTFTEIASFGGANGSGTVILETACSTGFNFVQALEISNPATLVTFYGDVGTPSTYQLSSLQFSFML